MPVFLDTAQIGQVSALKKKVKPQYYSAASKMKVPISEDFESFLILQGRPNNAQSLSWLQKAGLYAVKDADRDSLLATMIGNEKVDAIACSAELKPIYGSFQQFKQTFNMQGFEQVVECGMLLADLQRPMDELQALGDRHYHRRVFSTMVLAGLKNGGVTQDQQKQLNSWSGPLTAY